MPLDTALVHRARVVSNQRSSTRSAQGQYENSKMYGPWFEARVMLADRQGSPRQAVPGATDAGRAAVGYQVLAAPEDENGDPLTLPSSGWIETDCPVLGSPTLVISGQPEFLNNGDEAIGWLAVADVVEDIP